MILYFSGRGPIRRIGKIDGRMTAEKITAEITRQIKAFCDERNFKIHYTRIWNEELQGKPMTKFDVGSHSEFFYTYPQSYDMFVEQRRKEKEGEAT